ncbi:MAG: histidine phosphatase family protein [Clostridia bacterium]|nr:histidine phosphatase family protein [Clostridia bacterium]
MDLNDKSKGYIFFVRHGQTDWNLKKLMQGRDQIPLNETGLKQADWTAEAIKDACKKGSFSFDHVYSSPLVRAEVTGKKIADAISCDFSVDDRLIERDFGDMSGKPYDFSCPAILHDVPEISGLEPTSEVIARLNSFIRDNVRVGEKIIGVTHGSVTRIFAENAIKSPDIDNFEEVLSNCHMVIYSYDGKDILMECYNISPKNLDSLI